MFYKDKFVSCLLAALLLLRLAVLGYVLWGNPLGTSFFMFPDSLHYTYPAHTLLEQGTLLEAYTHEPLTFRTPGYPLFLALVWKLCGTQDAAVAFWQILLATALVALCYQTARVFLSRTAARAAAVCCAVSTVYWAYSFAYLSDILFAFCMTAFVWQAVRYIQSPRPAQLLAGSLWLAAAVYVRPVAYNMLFISLGLLVLWRFKAGWKPLVRAALVFLLPFVLLTGIWQLRNWQETGFNGFHSSSGYNLYFWNLDSVARERHLPATEGSRLLTEALPEHFTSWPLARRDEWLAQQAKTMIWKYWPEKLARFPYWLAKTLLGGSYTQLSRIFYGRPPLTSEEFDYQLNKTSPLPLQHLTRLQDWLLFSLCLLQTGAVALLAGWGACWMWRRRRLRNYLYFTGLYIGYFWGISSLFFGAGGRYRAPFESVLCVWAGAGAAALLQSLRHMRHKRITPAD